MTVYLDDMFNFLEENGIDTSKINVIEEPSTSKAKLKKLESKYNINDSLSVIKLSIDEAQDQYEITHDDFIDWCNAYENVIYFEEDSDKD